MVVEIKIPDIAESINEVTIATLLVPTHAIVSENQAILEVESDKLNQQVYAPVSGEVIWNVAEGDIVSVGAVVGKIEEGASRNSSENGETLENFEVDFVSETIKESQKEASSYEEKVIPLAALPVESSVGKPPESGNFVPLTQSKRFQEARLEERKRMSSIRKTISKRLVQSLHDSAMLTTFNEIDMTELISLRKQQQEDFTAKYGVKLGFMSFFIKAVVKALQEVPAINAYIDGDFIVYRKYFDIAVAVGTERGLVVPVMRNCDQQTSAELEKNLASLASLARNGGLSLDDLKGGSFTITNGGVYGSLLSTPIINPPQVGILGMHKIEKRPVVVNDEIVIREMMYVALSYDHRIVDGKEAVAFLVKIKELLEMPQSLLD